MLTNKHKEKYVFFLLVLFQSLFQCKFFACSCFHHFFGLMHKTLYKNCNRIYVGQLGRIFVGRNTEPQATFKSQDFCSNTFQIVLNFNHVEIYLLFFKLLQ